MALALVEDSCASLHLAADTNHACSQRWPILKRVVIGRESTDIQINVASLSRRHAEISPSSGSFFIRDLNSRNGTALNGRFVTSEPHLLKNGDSILLAGNVEFSFLIPLATPLVPRLGSTRGLWIDPVNEAVWVHARRLESSLSRKQFALLSLVYQANGNTVTRDEIAQVIWPQATAGHLSNDAIDSLVKRLRRKLKPLEGENCVIDIVRGRGIRLIRY